MEKQLEDKYIKAIRKALKERDRHTLIDVTNVIVGLHPLAFDILKDEGIDFHFDIDGVRVPVGIRAVQPTVEIKPHESLVALEPMIGNIKDAMFEFKRRMIIEDREIIEYNFTKMDFKGRDIVDTLQGIASKAHHERLLNDLVIYIPFQLMARAIHEMPTTGKLREVDNSTTLHLGITNIKTIPNSGHITEERCIVTEKGNGIRGLEALNGSEDYMDIRLLNYYKKMYGTDRIVVGEMDVGMLDDGVGFTVMDTEGHALGETVPDPIEMKLTPTDHKLMELQSVLGKKVVDAFISKTDVESDSFADGMIKALNDTTHEEE